ncbi:hypothetical protein Tco_1344370 [Tanacetum coccineum]
MVDCDGLSLAAIEGFLLVAYWEPMVASATFTICNVGVWDMKKWIKFIVLALGGHLEDVETAVEIIARPCDLSSDRVEDLTTASGRNRLKSVLEDSTW